MYFRLPACFLSLVLCVQCCVDEQGAPVSWFFIYKQPGAYSYAYLDANSPAGSTLKISSYSINTVDSALGKTLSPLFSGPSNPTPAPSPAPASSSTCCHYSDTTCSPGQTCCTSNCNDPSSCSYTESGCAGRYGQMHGCKWTGAACVVGSNHAHDEQTELAYVVYNDEVPNGATNSALAHAKGVLTFDGDSGKGYWLIHSLPKFPDLQDAQYSWTGSTKYGQSFLCLTLDSADINTAAKLVTTDVPNVYASNMPSTLASVLPDMASLVANPTQGGGTTRVASLTPIGGSDISFTVFAKSKAWAKDLYEDLVEPKFGAAFYWETWRRKPQEPTDCTFNSSAMFDTMNIEYMQFGTDLPFRYTKDHSKVGVSRSASDGWVCVGDINRMDSQSKRGGGTACTQGSPTFYAALSDAVYLHDSCSGKVVNPPPPPVTNAGLPAAQAEADESADGWPSPHPRGEASPHPGGEAPQCSCSVIVDNGHSRHHRRSKRTVAACNDDHGWLGSTFLCDSDAAPPGSVGRCLDSVQRSAGSDCGCLRRVCARPGRQPSVTAEAKTAPEPSQECAHACHGRCWLDPLSTCSGYDDEQSACVFFCTDYCLHRRGCVTNAPTNKSAEPLDKSDPPLTGPSNKSAEAIDKLDPPLTGPAAKWWCDRLHGCERSYLDPVWDRDEEKSAWRLSDYSDCKLRCLVHK